ncbi:MAG TPA: NfeD family protein [Microthrixaceae bacterium]|nr:NfeD family protein [Microthrixaceae bacterium]
MGTLSSRFPTSRRSKLAALACLAIGASMILGGIVPESAGAQNRCADVGCVDVIAVDGLIDEIEANSIIESVRRAERAGDVVAVVLQVNSGGSVVSDLRLNEIARVIADSTVPVSAWVGASGSEAIGGAAELVRVADSSSIAPGSVIGEVGTQRLDSRKFGNLFEGKAKAGLTKALKGEDAVEQGLVGRFDPTLVDHVGNLDAVDTKIVTVDGKKQKQPEQMVRISKLTLPIQIMHTAASPSVAYLLIVIGAALLLFEFFTAGVGVAGVVGAGFIILGGYGVAELPVAPWALGLFILSFVAFGIDMQTGMARVWTWVGLVAFTISSLFLFSEFRPSWLALASGIIGIAAVVLRGMPSMTRARFGTPFIGREWLEDEVGEVSSDLSPRGTVVVRGAEWRAQGVDDYRGVVGDSVKVVGTDGLVLEVQAEP